MLYAVFTCSRKYEFPGLKKMQIVYIETKLFNINEQHIVFGPCQ